MSRTAISVAGVVAAAMLADRWMSGDDAHEPAPARKQPRAGTGDDVLVTVL